MKELQTKKGRLYVAMNTFKNDKGEQIEYYRIVIDAPAPIGKMELGKLDSRTARCLIAGGYIG